MIRRHKPPRKQSANGKIEKKIYELIRRRLIAKYGCCQRCGSTNILQGAHILEKGSARYKRIRFEEYNLLLLCYRCHRHWWHVAGGEVRPWLESKWPGRFEELQIMAATAPRVDPKELLIVLELEAKR